MISKKISINKFFKYSIFLLISLPTIYLSIIANFDLLDSFALFMDERISFEGINRILNPKNLNDFFWAITDGGDHRYGRMFWNSAALFSLIPEYFFGEQGQIFSTRIFQVLLIVSSYLILSHIFIRSSLMRYILFFFLMNIPFTHYYMTMPKPEPLQLFFISIFLYYYKKNNAKINSFYWIFIGVAFGLKISILPLILVFLLPESLNLINAKKYQLLIEKYLSGFFYFIIGLSLSVPILVPQIIISLFIYFLINRITKNVFQNILTVLFLLFSNLSLSLYLFFKHNIISGLALWGGSTFLNTLHGGDNLDNTFFDWLNFLINEFSNVPNQLSLIFIIFSILIILRYLLLINFLKGLSIEKKIPVILILAGVISSIIIFLSVNRLWGFYLFINSILIITGILSIVDKNLIKKIDLKINQLYVLPIFLSLFYLIPENYNEYLKLSQRTQSDVYLNQYKSYKEILYFLDDYSVNSKNPLKIMYDPSLFTIPNNEKYQVDLFWGFITNWDIKSDIIILSKNHTPKREYIPRKDNIDYSKYKIEDENYKLLVHDKPLCDEHKTCFRKAMSLSNQGEILIKN